MFYPLFIDLEKRRVLVVGGGAVAERKVESLLEAGARIVLVSPEITERLRELAARTAIELRERHFTDSDLDGVDIAISATEVPEVQQHVATAARSKKVWINTVDQPELCDFIVPAVIRRGDVLLAISTSGKSPALSAALRRTLEGVVTENVARAAHILGMLRSEVHQRFPEAEERKRIFEQIVDSGILDWIGECDDAAALQRVRKMIEGVS